MSFEDKPEDEAKRETPPEPKPAAPITVQLSAESMKKKQAKKDEDPRITKFKNAEVIEKVLTPVRWVVWSKFFQQSVKEIYELAEQLIAGDGKKKLLKQIKQLKKALNLSVLKAQ